MILDQANSLGADRDRPGTFREWGLYLLDREQNWRPGIGQILLILPLRRRLAMPISVMTQSSETDRHNQC